MVKGADVVGIVVGLIVGLLLVVLVGQYLTAVVAWSGRDCGGASWVLPVIAGRPGMWDSCDRT